MNCNDISLLLDDHDTQALDEATRQAIDTHVAACQGCARDWELHAQVVAMRLPSFPPDLLDDCSAVAGSGPAAGRTHSKWKWGALAASVAVLAAAAVTLTLDRGTGPGAQLATLPTTGSLGQGGAAEPLAPGALQDVTRAQDSAGSRDNTTAQPVQGPAFTVLLSTSVEALDATDRASFDAFRAAVIDELRRTPGLILVLADPAAANQRADFELALVGVRRNGRLNGTLRVRDAAPGGLVQSIQGAFGQDCDSSCFKDAASLGEALAGKAVTMMLPPAAEQRPALLAELEDSSLPPQQRLQALRDLDLRRPQGRSGPRRVDPSGDSLRDPAIVQAVIDLAAVATSSVQRAEIWRTMRSIRDPALVEPLARAAELDPDDLVRAEAVATLAADYADDPRARAAFELIARVDSWALVRALARRGLSGEATWNSYVISSLKDTTLSDAQRLEAALFHARSAATPEQALSLLLDDEAIEALTQVQPRAADAGMKASDVRTLLTELASVRNPAVTRMLLASIEQLESPSDRRVVVSLLADRIGEPGVRAALERIAREDPDEQARQVATRALRENRSQLPLF